LFNLVGGVAGGCKPNPECLFGLVWVEPFQHLSSSVTVVHIEGEIIVIGF
jgi:hypothetical protein